MITNEWLSNANSMLFTFVRIHFFVQTHLIICLSSTHRTVYDSWTELFDLVPNPNFFVVCNKAENKNPENIKSLNFRWHYFLGKEEATKQLLSFVRNRSFSSSTSSFGPSHFSCFVRPPICLNCAHSLLKCFALFFFPLFAFLLQSTFFHNLQILFLQSLIEVKYEETGLFMKSAENRMFELSNLSTKFNENFPRIKPSVCSTNCLQQLSCTGVRSANGTFVTCFLPTSIFYRSIQ